MSFSQYMSGAFAAIAAFDGKRVKYARGNAFTHFTAVKGSTTFDATDQDGVSFQYVSTDFIFPACSLVLNDQQVEPKDSDLITFDGDTYQVLRQDGGQSWKYSDTGQTQIRVHTKRLKSKGA